MSAVYKIEIEEPEGQEPNLVVVDTIHGHVRELGGNLRDRDIEIANRVGIPAHRAIWRIYRKSLMCKTVFVDGEIVAIWGLFGTLLGKTGRPWLIASSFVEDYPMRLAFRYRMELRKMLRYFPVLEDWVSENDEKTIRLLTILGFEFGEKQSIGDVMFIKATLER